MNTLDDTIAAIATAPGEAGLAVLRVSGADAFSIADVIFRGSIRLGVADSHTLHHGWVVWPAKHEARGRLAGHPDGACDPAGHRIDEVVAAVFRAPRSYTREDVVEISCHGGRLSAERVLAALVRAGARMAGPGEFTQRAFLNGRMDLAQAEAVADVIHAETERAREVALSQLSGGLSRLLEGLADAIADALSEIEARVDFAEDVGGVEVPPHVIAAIASANRELATLLDGASFARAVREGIRLPIIGRPNVGKSSLFNALVGEDRAIVTATPGTTRDRVSEAIELEGIRITLSDLAGLRPARGAVEAIGVARAREALEESPLALWVVDGSVVLSDQDHRIAEALEGKRVVVAINKCDLAEVVPRAALEDRLGRTDHRIVSVSAARGDGMNELRGALKALLGAGRGDALAAAVGNPRHLEALGRARDALTRATDVVEGGSPGEIVAIELHECLEAIGEVTGTSVTEDLLDRIFSRFCIGK